MCFFFFNFVTYQNRPLLILSYPQNCLLYLIYYMNHNLGNLDDELMTLFIDY